MFIDDKIVFLNVSRFNSGAELIGAEIADYIVNNCSGVALVSPEIKNKYLINTTQTISLPIKYSKISGSKLSILVLLFYSFFILIKYRPTKQTEFYCNDIESVFLVGMSWLFFRCRIIWHVHDIYKLDRRLTFWIIKLATMICDRVIVLTEENKTRISTVINANFVYVIPNFCRLPINNRMMRRSLMEGEPIRFCFLGQISPWKGVLEIVKIVKNMNEIGWNIFLDIGGTVLCEKDASYFNLIIKEIHQNRHIKYIGEVSDPIHFFSNKDFLISFSTNEPFGLVLIEAISQGLRVISTKGDGPNDILKDSDNLLLDNTVGAVDQIGLYLKRITNSDDNYNFSADLFMSKYSRHQFRSMIAEVLNANDVG